MNNNHFALFGITLLNSVPYSDNVIVSTEQDGIIYASKIIP